MTLYVQAAGVCILGLCMHKDVLGQPKGMSGELKGWMQVPGAGRHRRAQGQIKFKMDSNQRVGSGK